MFIVVLGLIVLTVAFFHYTQGFFSAAISAILCIFSAVLAISYHEMIVEKFLGGAMANNAHGATVLVLFAVIYLILRVIFDKMIPGNVTMPAGASKGGAAVMGLVAGVVAAGVCAFAAQSMAFKPAIMGYSRFAYEDERDATIPQDNARHISLNLYDSLNTKEPLHLAEADQQGLIVPADDILIDMIKSLSDDGALASRPLASVHPNWLNELYGQRLGIQSAGGRVAMNKPDGSQIDVIATPDEAHKDAGPYHLNRQIPQRVHEFETIGGQREKVFPKMDPSKITIIIRTYFGEKAKDNKDGIIRFSMSSIRLVTQKQVPGTDEMQWTNYFPIGTLENAAEFWWNRPDDFLFIDDKTESQGVTDKGVDLVFQVEPKGFLKGNIQDPTQATISDGTFIEVKRMARVDLSGQPIQPMSKLKPNPAIQVLRKALVKNPKKVAQVESTDVPQTPEAIAEKLVGTWGSDDGESKVNMTVDPGQMQITIVADGKTTTKKGSWKITGEEGSYQIAHSAVGTDGKISQDSYGISFNSEDEISLNDANGSNYTLTRGGARAAPREAPETAPPETPETPATPENPKPQPNPQPAAMPQDTSLVYNEMYESPKFYAAIRFPEGSSGQVNVAGGTVTLEEATIKSLNLANTSQEQLNAGTGEPLNRLAAGTGSLIMLLDCTPGPGGWAWKDKVNQVSAVDRDGNKHRPNGVWAVDGTKVLVARYDADNVVTLADFTPTAAPTKVFFAFVIPEEQQITRIEVGNALLKQLPAPLP